MRFVAVTGRFSGQSCCVPLPAIARSKRATGSTKRGRPDAERGERRERRLERALGCSSPSPGPSHQRALARREVQLRRQRARRRGVFEGCPCAERELLVEARPALPFERPRGHPAAPEPRMVAVEEVNPELGAESTRISRLEATPCCCRERTRRRTRSRQRRSAWAGPTAASFCQRGAGACAAPRWSKWTAVHSLR